MNESIYNLVVIGGGPAGLAAASEAAREKLDKILIIERESALGGILKQCIHNGFGLQIFKKELTGPEYAALWIDQVHQLPIDIMLDTTVLSINQDKELIIVNSTGINKIKAHNILFAMGCRERTRGAIMTPGYRPAGIFTAGNAQKLVNIDGYLPGNKVVIVGSGDIGLIMARRMTLEGAEVKLVSEIMPYSTGLARNIAQCVKDFDIPLRFNTTITKIHGKERVCGVTIAYVDEKRQPITSTEEYVPCDTILFSVGLIPENELTKKLTIKMDPITNGPIVSEDMQTSLSGVYACGNVVHVHDLVDHVSQEALWVAKAITNKDHQPLAKPITIAHDQKIRYVVPQILNSTNYQNLVFSLRVTDIYKNVTITFLSDNKIIYQIKKPIVTPGEMITMNIKENVLKQIKNDLSLILEETSHD